MGKRLRIAALCLVIASLVAGCASKPVEGTSNKDLAPDFKLTDLAGKTVALSDFRGKPVMVNFWATWCTYCREEMPFIEEVNREYSGKGLTILAVDIGEKAETVQSFVDAYGLTFTTLLDSKQLVSELYGIGGLPTTLFIDKDGIIRYKQVGAFTGKAAIESNLKKIMPAS